MQIPDYELLQKCGHGAYGEVWIARSRSGQLVALKIIHRSEQVEKEFAGLTHYVKIGDSPHLIRIFHVGETDGSLYYTMELADNLGDEESYIPATLAEVLKRRKCLAPDETVELGRMLLDGLKTLHAARLAHRDLKPENILYVNGIPKLSDIGLVRSVSQTLTMGGTLGFIPPERLRSGSTGKGHADDLYALGKVLYCCLTGNRVDLFPSFPRDLIGDRESRRLNQVILAACAQDRFHRFRDTEEFRLALTDGMSSKKHLLSMAFRCRYYAGALLLIFTGLALLWPLLGPKPESVPVPPARSKEPTIPNQWPSEDTENATPNGNEPEPLLEFGTIAQRSQLDIIAYGDGVLYVPDDEDVLHHGKFIPRQLDGAPRRLQSVFADQFASDQAWDMADAYNFTIFDHTLIVGSRGMARLKQLLPSPYLIRFDIDVSDLGGEVVLQVAALDRQGRERAAYQWTLSRNGEGKLAVSPLTYRPEMGEAIVFMPLGGQPEDTKKVAKVEMLQTESLFRVYVDGKLIHYAPSFFLGGTFGFGANPQRGGGYWRIGNFRLFSIPHDPGCPPEEQYRLPGPALPPPQAKTLQPVMEITMERLEYLVRRHSSSAIAKIFGTDEATVTRRLTECDLHAVKVRPGGRQPRPLTDREIETLRRTLAEL